MQAVRSKKKKCSDQHVSSICSEEPLYIEDTESVDLNFDSIINTGDIIILEPNNDREHMIKNKVHPKPRKPLTYKNDIALEDLAASSSSTSIECDGVEVIYNETAIDNTANTYDEERDVEETKLAEHIKIKRISTKAELLSDHHSEEQILSKKFVDKNVVEDYLHLDRIKEETRLNNVLNGTIDHLTAHLSALNAEETILNATFVDKNALDEEFHMTRLREETRLSELNDHHNTAYTNHVMVEQEEERLKTLMTAKEKENLFEFEESPEIAVTNFDLRILDDINEEEDTNVKNIGKIMDLHTKINKFEAHQHTVERTVEEARLRDFAARAESFQRNESRDLIKQHTRHNLKEVDNAKLGKKEFTTQTGILHFSMSDSCSYKPRPGIFAIPKDCTYDQNVTSHDMYKDCHLVKDTGKWYLESDMEYENIVHGVQDFKSFIDSTARNIHLINNDSVIINRSLKHSIPKSGSMGVAKRAHLIPNDISYRNSATHEWSGDASTVNNVSGFSIHKGGVRVQRINAFSIPLPNTTELKNRCSHSIAVEGSMINKNKGLDLYKEGIIVQKGIHFGICDDGNLVQKRKHYSLCKGGSQDKQKRNYYFSLDGNQDKNNPSYDIPMFKKGKLLQNNTRHNVPSPSRSANVKQNNTHSQPNYSKYRPWKKNSFDIYMDAGLVHNLYMDVYSDCSHRVDNQSFEINEIDIDEEYLNEEDEFD